MITKHPSIFAFIVCILLTLTFLNTYIFSLDKPLSLIHGDAFLVNFILKHWMEVILSGNWSNLVTLPMFYGFENSLFFTDHHAIQALFVLPFYVLTKDIITSSNLLIVTTVLLSLFSMYLFCFFLTKKMVPSLIGAVIFVFNPFIFARFPDQLILFSLQWIPLVFLFFEKSLEKPKKTNLFLFFFFLTCQLLSSLYYSVFLTVIFPIYAGVRFWQEKISPFRLINIGAITGIVLFLATAVASGYFYTLVFSKYPINRSLTVVETYAAWPSDWLFTSEFNLLYGGLRQNVSSIFPSLVHQGIYSEHSLFLGIVPLIIFLLSFKILPKTSVKRLFLLFLSLAVFSFLLSFGPKIKFSENFSVPGLYGIVNFIDPFIGFLRTAARFGVFVFFFLALIIALTWSEIEKRLDKHKSLLLGIALIFLIMLEYWNKPLEFTRFTSDQRHFYEVLNSKSAIKVILNLPIGNLISYNFPQARSEDLDAHYLLYATALHNKKLFNGYTGFLPKEYYERGNYLSINFPTTEKLQRLKEWGVDGIILHKEEFNLESDFGRIKSELKAKAVPEVMSTENLALFDLTKWIRAR